MARDETSKYSDLMPDRKTRIFSFEMEATSVVTFPSGGSVLRAAPRDTDASAATWMCPDWARQVWA